MADTEAGTHVASGPEPTVWDSGGLHFTATFRSDSGATLRVYGPVAGCPKELLKFDDFVDSPHYHIPADAAPIPFDRATLGDPLEWFVTQLSDHIDELLRTAGFEEVLPRVDAVAIASNANQIRLAMTQCLPDSYVRVPGVGLQRVGETAATNAGAP
jgi:hypothetical protein